jgi:SAM-dependent methyltransferase
MTVASVPVARQGNFVVTLFAATALTSAALVFMVEPMIAKMVLPQLGGSPAVWNACMAFFQAALLAGYLYAHLLQQLPRISSQIVTHLALLAAASLVLPFGIDGAFGAPGVGAPVVWLLKVLTLSIGAPFAILSASAPLLQAWYVRSAVQASEAGNPYILYSASNLGSMLALLSYPTIVEPSLSVHSQSTGWSLGYFGFGVLMATIGMVVWRKTLPAPVGATQSIGAASVANAEPSWRARLQWLALAAVPSSLMLGATTYISDDVASVPFLWVIPLALYLLTFIVSFQAEPAISNERALLWQVVFVTMAAALLCISTSSLATHLFVYTGAFFFSALVCHRRLADSRPDARHLTEFYLCLSAGGVLGGMFNAFLAPQIFSSVAEFPLVLAAAVLARPWDGASLSRTSIAGTAIGIAAVAAIALVPDTRQTLYVPVALAVAGAAAAASVSKKTALFAMTIGAFCLEAVLVPPDREMNLLAARSFFGVYRVTSGIDPAMGRLHLMFHGTTIHGAQALTPAERCRATTYYAGTTPLGQALANVLSRHPRAHVGVVGLGVGTLATYTRPGDRMRFFEIDPEVQTIAQDRRYFTYLSDCAKGHIDVVLGDARLTLARERPADFDLLMLDAFSADTVPTHLLTVEALRLYLGLLKPDGILVLHLSNRNLALEAPVAATAREIGAIALMQDFAPPKSATVFGVTPTQAMLIAKSRDAASGFIGDKRWRPARDDGARPWTDDYSNVFGALLRKAMGR